MTLTASEALALAAILVTVMIAWRSETSTAAKARLQQAAEAATQRAESSAAIAALNAAVAEIKVAVAHLDKIPVMENELARLTDIVHEHSQRLHTAWQKLFSHDKHLAVVQVRQGSSPDLSVDK